MIVYVIYLFLFAIIGVIRGKYSLSFSRFIPCRIITIITNLRLFFDV